MSSSNVQSTISDMDWDDGFAIPVANDNNKKLESEVRTKSDAVRTTRLEADIHKKRSTALKDHLTHVQQDLKSTVHFLAAKKRENESEDHQKMIADREFGRLKQEIQRLKANLDENHESTIKYENQIYISNKKIADLQEDIAWDQKKLEQWLEESAKQDDNVLILHKYMKEDDSKLKQLMLTMERLTDEVKNARKALNAEHTETLTGQIEVDKTAEDFRKQQADREELIRQWKNTLDQMKARDNDISRKNNDIIEAKSGLNQEKNNLNQQQTFFEQEQQNNSELEKKIDARTRDSSKLIDILQRNQHELEDTQSDLQTEKFKVERVASDLEQLKATNRRMIETHGAKKKKLETIREDCERTKNELKEVEGAQLSAEQKAAAAERILDHEEQIVKNLQDQAKKAREMLFKRQQQLKKTLDEEVVLENLVEGDRSSLKNLNRRLKQLDGTILTQQETIYQQDYQLVNIERRLGKLQGEGMDQEEKEKLEAKVRGLTEDLEGKQAEKKTVAQQLKKLGDEVRRVNREMEKTDKEYVDLEAKIAEMDLQYESSQRELRNLEKENNSALVDDNLLRLEISRLRGSLAERVNSVVDLSQRRLQLNTAIKERKIHINNMKAMVNAEIKAAEGERSILSHDLHERITKIDKIRNRYDSLMILMAPPEGESEETQSQAYYVIKAAQEKEELQRYGDKLDQDIKKAEAENDALINTVRLVKMKNKKMHEALSPASAENSEEWKDLEKKLKAAQEKQKFKRNQCHELQRQINDIKETIGHAGENEGLAMNQLQQVSHELEKLDQTIVDQKVKLTRAQTSLSRFDRNKLSDHQNTDLDLRETRSLLAGAGRQLGVILRQHEEISVVARSMLQQVGLEPESIIPRSSSSNLLSARSNRSSAANSADSTPRNTPSKQTLNIGSHPPSVASSVSSIGKRSTGGRSAPRRTPVSSPLGSARSSAGSDLSLSGSKIRK